ncbi:MAG TPA: hypothetical protein VH107_19565 [Lacipirellulaceae bacterium]|jgi:hypothetical protein|nr:hypothetical protein [Lacipirellulaceae bacterium]
MPLLRTVVVFILSALVSQAVAAEPAAFFPIMAWDNLPNDPAVLQKLHDCGFTVAGFVPLSGLDACRAAGMQAIINEADTRDYDWSNVDPKVARTRVTQLIKEVGGRSGVFGYYLTDEPSAGLFPGLATVAAVVKEQQPGAWPYINLLPDYANAEQLGTPTYDEYLEKFIATCHPPLLSYDHYAILEGGAFRPEYFANLESMRRAALKHDLPFWQIVLSLGCLSYREPSEADMRFQVYTSLAYGARGIAYFKYLTPAEGNFRGGPIDQFGHENPMWHVMQQVNLQIGKLASTLLKLKSDRVYHFGDMPPGCAGPDDKSLVKSIAGPFLVGDFTHEDGSRYFMLVNKSFTNSVYCAPKLRKAAGRIDLISSYTGGASPFVGEQCYLAPGQGMLLKIIP